MSESKPAGTEICRVYSKKFPIMKLSSMHKRQLYIIRFFVGRKRAILHDRVLIVGDNRALFQPRHPMQKISD